MKNDIIKAERYMLKEMGFMVYVEHPQKYIPDYLRTLGLDQNDLVQLSWSYANDSLRTTLCLRFPPEVIATGCIYLAARVKGIPFPETLPWWELFDANEAHILS